MKTRVILRYVGVALIMTAAMMTVSGVVGVLNGCDDSTVPLFFSAFVTLVTGLFPLTFVRAQASITHNEGVAIVVASWVACCVFGMMPYLCYGGEFNLVNAFFESVSGFTTTGASILDDIEALPAGLLFWRASTAWVGGLGIVSIFSLVIPKSMDNRSVLASAEVSDITRSQSSKRGKPLILSILAVYAALTLACALALRIAGLGWFDALTDAMSTCSTCGFCVRNASIAAYGSVAVEAIIVLFMTISGLSFMMLFYLLSGRGLRRSSAVIARVYLTFLAIGTALITLNLHLSSQGMPLLRALRKAAFQMVSITTTTGFATADTSLWPSLSIIVLIIASVVCGCSGSTSGGLKMDRVVLVASFVKNGLRRAQSPNRVFSMRLGGKPVSEKVVSDAMTYALTYGALLAIGAVINSVFGLDAETGISAAIACLGNVGPGFGSVGSMCNYAEFPTVLKLNGVLLMIAGRLEIMPLLSFVGFIVRNGRV